MTDSLPPGSECIIHALPEEPRLAQRLAELGVLPGSRLRILRRSPLGETVEVAAEQGQNLALRAEELAVLQCEPVAMPLDTVPHTPGSRYRIQRLEGGMTFRRRMAAHGLRPGGEITLLGASPHLRVRPGQAVDEVELGRGETARVIVTLPATQDGR